MAKSHAAPFQFRQSRTMVWTTNVHTQRARHAHLCIGMSHFKRGTHHSVRGRLLKMGWMYLSDNRVTLALVAAIGFLSGCSDQIPRTARLEATNASSPNTVTVEPNVFKSTGKPIFIAHWKPNEAGMMAAVRGRLAVQKNCLVLAETDVGPSELLVLPAGKYSWDINTETLEYEGLKYKIGEVFGGVIPAGGGTGHTSLMVPYNQFTPYGCNTTGLMMFVN
jgi:hypothetical protein